MDLDQGHAWPGLLVHSSSIHLGPWFCQLYDMRHLQGSLLYPKCFCNNPLSQLIDIPPLDVVFSPSPESNRSCSSSFLLLDSSRLRHTGTHVETPHTSTRTLHQALVPFSHYQGFVPQFCSHFTLYQYGIPLDSIARSLPRRLELNFLYVYRHSLFQNQLAPFLFGRHVDTFFDHCWEPYNRLYLFLLLLPR